MIFVAVVFIFFSITVEKTSKKLSTLLLNRNPSDKQNLLKLQRNENNFFFGINNKKCLLISLGREYSDNHEVLIQIFFFLLFY